MVIRGSVVMVVYYLGVARMPSVDLTIVRRGRRRSGLPADLPVDDGLRRRQTSNTGDALGCDVAGMDVRHHRHRTELTQPGHHRTRRLTGVAVPLVRRAHDPGDLGRQAVGPAGRRGLHEADDPAVLPAPQDPVEP